MSSHSSHHPQDVLLAQFSLYVHKGGLKTNLFHFTTPAYRNCCDMCRNQLNQQTRDVIPMLGHCCASVVDAGTALAQHLDNDAWCLLRNAQFGCCKAGITISFGRNFVQTIVFQVDTFLFLLLFNCRFCAHISY